MMLCNTIDTPNIAIGCLVASESDTWCGVCLTFVAIGSIRSIPSPTYTRPASEQGVLG